MGNGPLDLRAYLLATAYVAIALIAGMVLDQVLGVRNLALVFLMAVLASAVIHGLRPALYSCIISALAFNFFFLPPRYRLKISDPESVLALFFFSAIPRCWEAILDDRFERISLLSDDMSG